MKKILNFCSFAALWLGVAVFVNAQFPKPGSSGGGGGTTYTFSAPLSESGGTVSCPTCSTAAPGMVLVEQHTASNSASLDFTTGITSTYDNYVLVVDSLVAASNADLLLRFSEDAGMTFVAGTSYNWARSFYHSGGASGDGANGTSAIKLAAGGGTTSNWSYNGSVNIHSPLGSKYKLTDCHIVHPSAGNALLAHLGSGIYLSTNAVNALQIIMSTGNITSGTVYLYGLKR